MRGCMVLSDWLDLNHNRKFMMILVYNAVYVSLAYYLYTKSVLMFNYKHIV